MTNGESRGERQQIMLIGEELTLLDDFRFKARMPSCGTAVRELLKARRALFEWIPIFLAVSTGFGVIASLILGKFFD